MLNHVVSFFPLWLGPAFQMLVLGFLISFVLVAFGNTTVLETVTRHVKPLGWLAPWTAKVPFLSRFFANLGNPLAGAVKNTDVRWNVIVAQGVIIGYGLLIAYATIYYFLAFIGVIAAIAIFFAFIAAFFTGILKLADTGASQQKAFETTEQSRVCGYPASHDANMGE